MDLLTELEPVVENNLERHLAASQDWLPHEYVPWSRGRDFPELGGEAWSPEQSTLSPVARTALELNLLTEDNLPSYHREIALRFGQDGAWGTWVNRWTAEEGRHAIVIRDYLVVTRGIDPERLERGRMAVVQAGFSGADRTILRALTYVALQELATRVSHRNTGRSTDDPVAERLLQRVAMDESLHMVFYRNIVDAAFELDPSSTMCALAEEIAGFEMPGTMVPDFARKAIEIARAGIYNLRVHHDDVLQPLLRAWRVLDRDDVSGAGAAAQERIAALVADVDARARRQESRRAVALA